AKDIRDIGASESCEIDVACVMPQSTALRNSAKAVAKIVYTQEDGVTYLCSGTLVNDLIASNTPYFFTANHCINSATAARTINAYWFFDAVTCGSTAVPPYVQQATGSSLLARSEDWDWALVRLVVPPPAGTFFSAWRAEPVATQATVSVLHHPSGDLKKWAQGISPGYQSFTDGSSFIKAVYSQGTTEGGSSGAALITFNATGGFYEVRGALFGGEASCSNLAGTDIYSRLDNMLPLTRQYLTPGNNPSGTVVAVEFYNRSLQHYFISTSPAEINDLDTGVHQGWERTGLRFLAYGSPVTGTNPVCRFYRAPAYGDSHFYSASPAECSATAAAHPIDWIYESPNVFYIQLPNTTSGACPASTLPIWRFFNQVTTNHRYTADVTTRDAMRADAFTWVPEGYGPDAVIMCTPVGS
ncbi:MAG: serine protease, partial [Betaproteobacteria bacterium]